MTSLDEPVGQTCRTIDNIIRSLDWARGELKGMEGVESALHYMEVGDELEELRSANDKLRRWGNDLAGEVEELRSKISQIEQIIR